MERSGSVVLLRSLRRRLRLSLCLLLLRGFLPSVLAVCITLPLPVHAAQLPADADTFDPGAGAESLATQSDPVSNLQILIGAAEKTGRELRAKSVLAVTGERRTALWKLRSGADLDEEFASAIAQLDGDVLFSCEGRDCGRSTAWANLVFDEPLVYGQDRFQRYRVVRDNAGVLRWIYLVQRGNRRLHLMHGVVAGAGTLEQRRSAVLTQLNDTGAVRLALELGDAGVLSAEQLEMLGNVGAQLAPLKVGEIYVVCHLYGSQSVADLLENSESCAAAAATALQDGYAGNQLSGVSEASRNRARPSGSRFMPFGAGPLLPRLLPGKGPSAANEGSAAADRKKAADPRIELVLPARIRAQ